MTQPPFRVGELVFLGKKTRATIIELHGTEATVQHSRGTVRQRVPLGNLSKKPDCGCKGKRKVDWV